MPKGQAFDITLLAELTGAEIKKVGETTTTELFKPAAGKLFRLTSLILEAEVATIASLEDETTVFMVIPLPAKVVVPYNFASLPQSGYLSKAATNKLKIKLTASAKVAGSFMGIEDVA